MNALIYIQNQMDQRIILKDAHNSICFNLDKNILKTIPYFDALLSFESDQEIILEVPDVLAASIILQSLNKEDYKCKLEQIRFQDFLGLEPSIPLDLKIPVEGFDLLLEIVHIMGFRDDFMELLINNLPQNYDLALLSQELIHKMIKKATKDRIITGGADGNIIIWDMDGTIVSTIKDNYNWVRGLAYMGITGRIVSVNNEDKVNVWDPATGTLIHSLKDHKDWVWAVACSPDEKYIASGSRDSTIKIWDAATGSLVHTFQNDS